MKAQNFVKQFAPQYEGSDTIPHHAVLALMESFKSHCMIEYLDTLLKQNNPQPHYGIHDLDNAVESAKMDAVIDEDKMTLPYKVGDRFTNGFRILRINPPDFTYRYILVNDNEITELYSESELNELTLIDNDLPHVEHTEI